MRRPPHVRRVPTDVWTEGAGYEAYVGRWSRAVARAFVPWLNVPAHRAWLDVGCGTGVLAGAIAECASPVRVLGIDRSERFVEHARARVARGAVTFRVGDAQALPVGTEEFDAVVSGLVLNFVPAPERMISEMARAARPGSTIAAYVWDYAGGMQLIRCFWDAAAAIDPRAKELDEAVRFPGCAPGPLSALLASAGLSDVEARPIDVPTRFRDLDDYWSPFLRGQGPAPTYAMSLPEDRRHALHRALREALPSDPDGSIRLTARAWAVRGTKP